MRVLNNFKTKIIEIEDIVLKPKDVRSRAMCE